MEIRVGLFRAGGFDGAFHAHLFREFLPVETQRGAGILRDFPALAAFPIGKQQEAARVPAFHQHHARGRAAVRRRGGKADRIGFRDALMRFGLRVPLSE